MYKGAKCPSTTYSRPAPAYTFRLKSRSLNIPGAACTRAPITPLPPAAGQHQPAPSASSPGPSTSRGAACTRAPSTPPTPVAGLFLLPPAQDPQHPGRQHVQGRQAPSTTCSRPAPACSFRLQSRTLNIPGGAGPRDSQCCKAN